MGSLKAGLSGQKTEPFAEAFDYVQKQLDLRFIMTAIWLRLGRFVGNRPKMIAARQTLENYAYELIDSRAANPNKDTEVYQDLLGLFMSFTDEKGLSLSRSELKDSALNLIIAGR
jgi:fatty acid omega-hydroxylase